MVTKASIYDEYLTFLTKTWMIDLLPLLSNSSLKRASKTASRKPLPLASCCTNIISNIDGVNRNKLYIGREIDVHSFHEAIDVYTNLP